jgi:transposase-like protein
VHSLDNVIIFNAMQYTNTEKVALARKASLPGCSIASVARGEGLPQSSVKGYIKNIKKLEENSSMENNLKATHIYRTPIIMKALITSCSNYS